jgi:hypothetical protein
MFSSILTHPQEGTIRYFRIKAKPTACLVMIVVMDHQHVVSIAKMVDVVCLHPVNLLWNLVTGQSHLVTLHPRHIALLLRVNLLLRLEWLISQLTLPPWCPSWRPRKKSERPKIHIHDAWRKRGQEMRSQLVLDDGQAGGSTFVLNSNYSIDRYYAVAEQVLRQL